MNEQLDRIEAKLAELETRVALTYAAAEKTRKILWWTGVITVAAIAIPVLLIPLFLPAFMSSVSGSLPTGV